MKHQTEARRLCKAVKFYLRARALYGDGHVITEMYNDILTTRRDRYYALRDSK